jgi:hypothetical protein
LIGVLKKTIAYAYHNPMDGRAKPEDVINYCAAVAREHPSKMTEYTSKLLPGGNPGLDETLTLKARCEKNMTEQEELKAEIDKLCIKHKGSYFILVGSETEVAAMLAPSHQPE